MSGDGRRAMGSKSSGIAMKSKVFLSVALAAGVLSFAADAQQSFIRPPMVPQAIEMHLQQTRTLEQREAIVEKKVVAPSSSLHSVPGRGLQSSSKPAPKKVQRAAKPAAIVQESTI